ncbi:hypothetical protein CUS89_06615 [Enterococcus mundtii]|uniref:Uncharacterized protein n=1 Tax=Enterococcus mundtii TaxID=53346 RepID=A0A2S7RUT6_ENTMU|nr:hypothetical protein CUS89_06615 [Enterococcus mundtii]
MPKSPQHGSKLVQIVWLFQLLTLYTFFLTTKNQNHQFSHLLIQSMLIISLGLHTSFIRGNKRYTLGVIFTDKKSTAMQAVERIIWLLLIIGYVFVIYRIYYK